MSLYKSGMGKAKKHNHERALADYTEAIDMQQASMRDDRDATLQSSFSFCCLGKHQIDGPSKTFANKSTK